MSSMEDIEYSNDQIDYIKCGRRGEIINGTPIEYSNLYTRCWKYEPNERPHMEELVSTLKSLKNNYFNERKEDNSSIKNNYNLEVLSKRTTDLNYSSQYKNIKLDSESASK
ncbi:8541_t:CDS:2 [Rhizophagus irregularis]|nr:8541_t:CDS:2 [Rhizophagus irregularis]